MDLSYQDDRLSPRPVNDLASGSEPIIEGVSTLEWRRGRACDSAIWRCGYAVTEVITVRRRHVSTYGDFTLPLSDLRCDSRYLFMRSLKVH